MKGRRQRYYILVCKDAFDGAVCLKLGRSRKMDTVLTFLGECWKSLGRPEQMQFDNAREFLGWGPAARYLSRVIRLCLRFGIEPIFIPPGRPQRQGSVENFNTYRRNWSPKTITIIRPNVRVAEPGLTEVSPAPGCPNSPNSKSSRKSTTTGASARPY